MTNAKDVVYNLNEACSLFLDIFNMKEADVETVLNRNVANYVLMDISLFSC